MSIQRIFLKTYFGRMIPMLAGVGLGLFLFFMASIFPVALRAETEKQPRGSVSEQWSPPRFSERAEARERMVEEQIGRHRPAVQDAAVFEAMRRIPRHLFVSPELRGVAYADRPLPIGYGQTISQPYIVALMTELLQVKPGDKILEIGTGSGYQAAVLSELTPRVFSMEIIRPLGEEARRRLHRLGYQTVEVKIGDGYFGWPEKAPFDGIIVTCAAGHIPPPLLDQLRTDGRLVIPVGEVYQVQRLMVITRGEEGTVRTREVLPVAFVPMTGAIQGKP